MSLEPIGLPRFNRGLGSFVMLLCNFPVGISILAGIFAARICDFVTFVESIKHQAIDSQDLVNELFSELLVQIALYGDQGEIKMIHFM